MGYLPISERDKRIAAVKQIMEAKNLDIALVYYDEFNIGNGWYLTGWCPQFESGAVLIPRNGEPMVLGGPESEPFAKMDSAITETRNFPVFMVPDEEYPNATIISFPKLFAELNGLLGQVKRVGMVGAGRMPQECYSQIIDGFTGCEMVDISEEFLTLRYIKSDWELEQIAAGFALADLAHEAMLSAIKPGASEIQVAAAGEYAVRSKGATGFGFTAIVGSGARADAVVPTASSKQLVDGEIVMVGLAPKVAGYNGVMGDSIAVSGKMTAEQADCYKFLKEALRLTKAMLIPGKTGAEVDVPARALYAKHDMLKYIVCPFAHTIGLHEAEAPFFGPNSKDVIKPGMAICVDVSFFGHPTLYGARIETGYRITEDGPVPFSPKMDKWLTQD